MFKQKYQFCNSLKIHKIAISFLLLLGMFFGFISHIMAQVTSPMWDYPIDLTQASSSTNAIDPVILCDQNQNTHVLWGDRDEAPALYYMNDASGEWSAPIDVIASSDNLALIMRLSAALQNDPEILHVLWIDEYISGVLNYSQVALSDANDPRAWIIPIPIAVGVENGSIDVDENGNLHVVYGVSGIDSSEVLINYIFSADQGKTWSPPIQIFSKKVPFPSDPITFLDVDNKGRIHVGISIRSQDYGEYSEIGYIRSLDDRSSWSEYLLIDDVGTAYQGVNLLTPFAFEGDEIHLTWHDPRRMHQWSQDGGTTWSDPIEIMHLGAAFGGSNALAKDSRGTLYVVTAENGGVFSASWDGSRWGIPERIEDRSIDPHGQNISICQGNKLQIIYDDRSDTQRIWYSYRIVNAPSKIQTHIRTSNEKLTLDATQISENFINEESPSEIFDSEIISEWDIPISSTRNVLPSSPLTPILIASGIVTGLILVLVIIKRK